MKKLVLLLLFFFVISSQLNAQMQESSEQVRIKQVVTKFFDGLAALDIKVIKQYSTKDFLLLEDGAVWNIDTLGNKLSPLKAVSFSRTNYLSFIHTEVKGKIAWVAYNNTADIIVNGQKRNVEWLESAVLINDEKEWKIQMLHSTPLKPKTN